MSSNETGRPSLTITMQSTLREFTSFVWWMGNSARWPPTFGSQSAWAADRPIASYGVYIHHRHLLQLSSKADTQLTIPTRFPCLQTVTYPSSNRAQRTATLLIETNALLLAQTAMFNYRTCAQPYSSEICRCPELSRLRTNWLVEWLIRNEWLTVCFADLWIFIAVVTAVIVSITQWAFIDTLIAASRTWNRMTTAINWIGYNIVTLMWHRIVSCCKTFSRSRDSLQSVK